MELTRLLDPSSVAVGVEVSDKESLLNAAIDLVADRKGVLDADAMREAVFEREKRCLQASERGWGCRMPKRLP